MAHRPKVLLVDDDASMRELLVTIFELHGGFRIAGVAADGFEAAMLAMDCEPDVIVLDFFMPRWDGERAAEFIRERCPATKIIAFSAVLTDPPEWGDGFLIKNHIERLIPMAEKLLGLDAQAQAV